jgi:antitoxin (DNA-binding transcriptional repressor) of toxin-antitoxin stability system
VAKLSATDAARSFSEVLNRATAGEEIEITRSGATVAVIGPPKTRLIPAERYRELMRSAPPVDDDFAADLRDIRDAVAPAEGSWPS